MDTTYQVETTHTEIKTRINIEKLAPAGYNAVLGLEKFIESSPLTRKHKDLIKIRSSQINGCAFCINMHTRDARKAGETEQRIYALDAWRDTRFFSEDERAILALTEEVTLINNHVKDSTYEQAANVLEETYLAQVILAIITINVWNRIGIATNLVPA
jgi:AhpD family alkylhydroperoxidase